MTSTMAIFDLDGTLLRRHMWGGFLRYYFVHKTRRAWIAVFWARHLPLWALAKGRLISQERLRTVWVQDLSAIFEGASREEVLEVFRWITDKYLFQSLRRDVIKILNRHKESGHVVVLISGNFTELLEVVGEQLGAAAVVGTMTELLDGRYTGRVVGPVCFGTNKVRLLQEVIARRGLQVDLSSSFAYADSYSDTPLLKLVGNPVATYPDKELHRLALRNGWQILA